MYVLMTILPIEKMWSLPAAFSLSFTQETTWIWTLSVSAEIVLMLISVLGVERYISGCTLWLQILVVTKSLFKVFFYSALYLGYKGNQTSITKSNMSLISSFMFSFPLCKRCNGKGDSNTVKINFVLWKCEEHMVKS